MTTRARRLPPLESPPTARDYRLSPGRRVQLRRVARYAIGVLLAGSIAAALGIGHPYWAMVSAVVPISAGAFAAGLARGTQRILGTTLGVLLAAGVLLLDPSALVIVLLVAVIACALGTTGAGAVRGCSFCSSSSAPSPVTTIDRGAARSRFPLTNPVV